ncbi:MAG TPA: creatininase family protein [Candidatus Deferrimicrobium sp.]|nr:creatininase family protein [Candidatus Deferrimicrobium sp.]
MKFDNLTWTEFEHLAQSMKTVIVPWGALEAHGPHLPLSTDTIIADHIAELIAEKINALKIPPIPIGYSFHVSNFPGTLSLTEETLKQMAFELAGSLSSQGIQTLIFLSGHGGNVAPLEEIAEKIQEELPLSVLVIFPYSLDDALIEKFNTIRTSDSLYSVYHAEEIETSLMLAISPHLVQMNKAKIEYPQLTKDHFEYKKKAGEASRYCIFGDPTVATKEKGVQFLQAILEEILKFLETYEN